MKKLIFSALLMLGLIGMSKAQSSAQFIPISTAVTNLALTSTNTGAGTAIMIPNASNPVRIWVSANGVQGTTNGTLIVKFSTASGTYNSTNNYDNAAESLVKVTLTTLANATNSAAPTTFYTASDVFDLSGVKYIRAGQIENTFQGVVSNITIRLGYQN
jgi:hypothetical protein